MLNETRHISGSILKVIALVSMLVDHLAAFAWNRLSAFNAPIVELGGVSLSICNLCRLFGRVAFPVFCFLLVEGYMHTHDRKAYGLNLAVFALISELPWDLASSGALEAERQNVMFTLLLGFLGLLSLDSLRGWKQWMCLAGLMLLSVILRSDYGAKGFVLILLIYACKQALPVQALSCALLLPDGWMAALSYVPISMYNGKRGFIQGRTLKYLFYAFYPVHLFLIWLLTRL